MGNALFRLAGWGGKGLAAATALAPGIAGAAQRSDAVNPSGLAGAQISAQTFWLYLAGFLLVAGLLLLAVTMMAIIRRRRIDITAPLPPIESVSLSSSPATARAPRLGSAPRPQAPPQSPRTPPPATPNPTSGQVVEAQRLFDLMGDAEELVGRLSVQLNEHVERLQRVMRAAEERIERLEELSAESRPVIPPVEHAAAYRAVVAAGGGTPRQPAHPAPSAPPLPPAPSTPQRTALPPIVTRPRTAAPVSSAPLQATRSARPASRSDGASTLDPLTTEIYRLADDGLPVVDIAKQLGQHTGKVELILALRQR